LRALAPEASESTNSTTRASGALISAGFIIPCDSFFVNTFFALDKILFLQYNKQAVRDYSINADVLELVDWLA
jgi:hypothetical protein